jgi:hypothetical protein
LCGMEQARRPALAHHVHRTAPMGPRVLINRTWYYNGIPYATEQGIFKCVSGNFSRETGKFSHATAKPLN